MTRILTDSDRAEAKRIRGLIDAAKSAISDYKAPALTVATRQEPDSTPDDTYLALVCPWCGDELDQDGGVTSVDMSDERWTYGQTDVDDQCVAFDYHGHADYHGVFYQTACCELPVDLPEGWDEN